MRSLKFLIIIVVLITGCKKIQVPNDDAKKIFGSWNYKFSSGGFSGQGDSQTYKVGDWVSFSENGKFTMHRENKTILKTNYKIEMQKSIINNQLRPIITCKSIINESFSVDGDTLVLSQEAYDGFQYVFIKK